MGELHKPRIGILLSGDVESGGGGSTADKVVRDSLEGKVGFKVGVLVCNNSEKRVPGAYARFEEINKDFGLKGDDRVEVVNIGSKTHPDGPQRRGQTFSESAAICRLFEERAIDFAFMLGYMKVVTCEFLETWCWQPHYAQVPGFEYRNGLYHPNSRTSNNHPSILPFTADTHGPGAHEAAIRLYREGKITHSAMTWHLGAEEVDKGPIMREEPVEILPNYDAGILGSKVQLVEKALTAPVLERHLILRDQHLRAA